MTQKKPPDPELVVATWLWYKARYLGPYVYTGFADGSRPPVGYLELGGRPTWEGKRNNYHVSARTHRRRLIDFAYSLYGPGYGFKVVAAFAQYDSDQRTTQRNSDS